MTEQEIISVCFKRGGRQYFFDPEGEEIRVGEALIVETARGNEFGECVKSNFMINTEKIPSPLRKVIRRATEKDCAVVEKNKMRESWAKTVCLEKIALHKLEMKLVQVEYSFEGNKVLFYFTSDGRVDFRGLVRDLAATIHARIELRQIGVRDEAKMLGGLGICGRPYCCNQFLDKFAPVSIKMAKTQNLSLNPAKISGTCGRLMCCLKYEQDAYEYLLKNAPKSDSFVETPDGAGTIQAINLLRQQVTVRLESDPSVAKKYHNSEIVVVRSGKGRRPEGYVEPPQKVLEKQRRIVDEPKETTNTGGNTLASNLESILNPVTPQPHSNQQGKGKQGEGRQISRNYRGKKPNPNHVGKQSGERDGNQPKTPNKGQGNNKPGQKRNPNQKNNGSGKGKSAPPPRNNEKRPQGQGQQTASGNKNQGVKKFKPKEKSEKPKDKES